MIKFYEKVCGEVFLWKVELGVLIYFRLKCWGVGVVIGLVEFGVLVWYFVGCFLVVVGEGCVMFGYCVFDVFVVCVVYEGFVFWSVVYDVVEDWVQCLCVLQIYVVVCLVDDEFYGYELSEWNLCQFVGEFGDFGVEFFEWYGEVD